MARNVSLAAPTFDLESWAANYDGVLLPRRLIHIALHCPPIANQAFAAAQASLRQGKDVNLYRILVEAATSRNLDLHNDAEWASHQEEANRREHARLESELRGYKNNLIRESIRMGQEDLANHLLSTGGPKQPVIDEGSDQIAVGQYGLSAAYTAYGRMRDFCNTPSHVAGMTLRMLFTAIVQAIVAQQSGHPAAGHFQAANAHASRLKSIGAKEEEQTRLTMISNAAAGIASLGQSNYQDASHSFLQVPFELSTNGVVQGFDFCRTTASANDIAVYGGLTSLATLSRADLNDKVLGGSFRAYLELEPHVRKAITLFTTGKYRACLDTLQRYYSDWNLDIFLGAGLDSAQGSHVDRLFALIREKSITAYFSSFSQVSLTSLAATFPPTQSDNMTPEIVIEQEIISMIEAGKLQARLDAVNGVLVSPSQDRRTTTQKAAIDTALDVERNLLQRLYKVNVGMARMEIVRPKQGGQKWQQSQA